MSNDGKFFARPKVRFSQIDAEKSQTEKFKNQTDQKGTLPSGKPKIRSVVTIDKPVKLLKSTSDEGKELSSINKSQRNESLAVCSNRLTSSCKSSSVKADQKFLSDSNNAQNIKANPKESDAPKISEKSSSSDIIPCLTPAVQDQGSKKALKSQTSLKRNVSKKSNIKTDKGKENEPSTANRDKNTTKKIIASKSRENKNKPSSSSASIKQSNVTSKSSTRNSKSRPVIGVMPCHKYSKAASKAKTIPVKKTMIRDIIGPKIKPHIGPGMQHARKGSIKVSETEERNYTKLCVSGDKLTKPEYNSIMCTINKMNEIEKQEVVTDVEHLPPAYKHFINRKISSALDFPLDEAVYKNLVDLTIDENQLPSRLTRSKDPEPRQKDIVPVLSDFFTPSFAEEYCTSVPVKPRAPEMIDNWNAFKVSDKIFEWKHALDYA